MILLMDNPVERDNLVKTTLSDVRIGRKKAIFNVFMEAFMSSVGAG